MMIDPSIYQAMVIRTGLEFYRSYGRPINRAYTPKNMMAMASKITGKTFKPRDYATAAMHLTLWIEARQSDLAP